jgi:hypothetical protein
MPQFFQLFLTHISQTNSRSFETARPALEAVVWLSTKPTQGFAPPPSKVGVASGILHLRMIATDTRGASKAIKMLLKFC